MASRQKRELAKLQSGGTLAKPGTLDRLVKFLTQLAILLVWKSFTTLSLALSVPVGKLVALNIWCCRSVGKYVTYLQKQTIRAAGYAAGPAFAEKHQITRFSRDYLGQDPRRYHVGIGEAASSGRRAAQRGAVRKWVCVRNSLAQPAALARMAPRRSAPEWRAAAPMTPPLCRRAALPGAGRRSGASLSATFGGCRIFGLHRLLALPLGTPFPARGRAPACVAPQSAARVELCLPALTPLPPTAPHTPRHSHPSGAQRRIGCRQVCEGAV